MPKSQHWPTALRSIICGLNDLAGFSQEPGDFQSPSDPSVVQKNLARRIERFDVWDTPCPGVTFNQLFTTKTVDYCGEEVKVAQRLEWSRVAQSLPDGVGLLRLEDFCRAGTLHYVQNFTDYLLPMDAVKVPRAPTVMVEPGSWGDLCKGLVDKNICEIRPVANLFHFGGVPLLNGICSGQRGVCVGR